MPAGADVPTDVNDAADCTKATPYSTIVKGTGTDTKGEVKEFAKLSLCVGAVDSVGEVGGDGCRI